MALTELIFGFGGVKIIGIDKTFELSTCHGDVIYTPVVIWKEDIDYILRPKRQGWRVTIELDLTNIYTDDYKQFQYLMYMLGGVRLMNTVDIYPRYTSGESELHYDAYLKSEIFPKDVHQLKVGQTLKLKFIVPELRQQITTTISGTPYAPNAVDENGAEISDDDVPTNTITLGDIET